jgi:hypothetical protein
MAMEGRQIAVGLWNGILIEKEINEHRTLIEP